MKNNRCRRWRFLPPPWSITRLARLVGCAGILAIGCATAKPAPTLKTYVVLLPEEGGGATAVILGEGNNPTILDRPLTSATIDSQGKIEQKPITAQEVERDFGPALAAQPPKPISFTLYFETNSTQITASSRPQLEALMSDAARRQAVEVQVTGHTDRVGSDADNDRLSLQRAEAVRTMLVQNGIKATFIRAVGRGEREPLVPTADEQPEARNRRVEVILR